MRTACAFLWLLLLAPALDAQVLRGRPVSAGADATVKERLEQKALDLLKVTAGEAGNLKLVENRVHVQGAAASLLWPRDAEAARSLFRQAADGVAQLIDSADPADPRFLNQLQIISQLRAELLAVAAPHDAKAALDFLRATRQPTPYVYPDAGHRLRDEELALETSLAAQVAARDPQLALRIAEEGLSRGLSHDLTNILYQLVSKDPAAAKKLATEIIGNLRAGELATDVEAAHVAIQLFSLTRSDVPPVSGGSRGEAMLPANPNIVMVDDAVRRQLVGTLVAASLTRTAGHYTDGAQNIIDALRSAMPEVERYAPTRVNAFRGRAEELRRAVDSHADGRQEYSELMQSGTIEVILETAPRVPAGARDQLYGHAAWKAMSENDHERAQQIAANIANPQQRAQTLRDMEQQFYMRAAELGGMREVRLMLARVSSVEERSTALVQLANVCLRRGDRQMARVLLEEARALVGRAESAPQFYSLLSITHAYTQLDEGESFEIAAGVVERLNELLAAAAVVNGFGQEAFREGELRRRGGSIWNDLLNRCAQELGELAGRDFDRALALTQNFQRPDARVTVQLLLAQHVLQRIPTKGVRSPDSPLHHRVFLSK